MEEKFKQIVVEQLGCLESDVKPTTHFEDDLMIDSLDAVELVIASEDAFEIEIPDGDYDNIKTVQQAIDYLKTRVSEHGA